MRIRWLLARRDPDLPSPLVLEVTGLLRARGHEVDGVLCEDVLTPVAGARDEAPHDLVVLKSHTELALSLASTLEDEGAAVLNAAAACRVVQDKLLTTRRLAAAGVPVPRTHVTASWDCVAELAVTGPVLVKPLRGHRGVGVEVVPGPSGLTARRAPVAPMLAQELVPGSGEDLKVYVAGRRVWAVRKPFSPRSFAVAGRPVEVDDEVARIALRVGEVCGLELYGIDVLESPEGPVVVDVNSLPGYKGCVGVAAPIAELVHRAALDAGATRHGVA